MWTLFYEYTKARATHKQIPLDLQRFTQFTTACPGQPQQRLYHHVHIPEDKEDNLEVSFPSSSCLTMCRWVFSDGWVVYKFSWCGIYSSPQPPALPLTCGNHFHSQSSQKIALRLLIGNIWECRLWELQTFSWNSPQFFFQNLRISAQLLFLMWPAFHILKHLL